MRSFRLRRAKLAGERKRGDLSRNPSCVNMIWLSFAWLMLTLSTSQARATDIIHVYTYHSHPPFIVSKDRGLTYDLAAYLTKQSAKRYSFVVSVVSRPRLNKIVEIPQSAIVPWVNPAWFKDTEESRFQWSAGILLSDGNALVSRKDNKVNYDGPASLEGLVIGGLRGHNYVDIDAYISGAKSTRRVDANMHSENFKKLLDRRIDVMLIPTSAASYLAKLYNIKDLLYFSPRPHSRYERRVIILSDKAEIKEYVEAKLSALSDDPDWSLQMAKYR